MMRTIVIRLLIAAGLATGAYASWTEAGRAERAADASQRIATLRFADVEADADPATTATVAYWLGRYGSVTADTTSGESDAYVLRTAANAAFRAYERGPGVGPAAVQRLDGVLQAYALALKASLRDVDAAYNYEYVARVRDMLARAKGKPLKPETAAPAPLVAGDLPAGPTIHGRPGAPPPDAKMEELQMLAPMEFGDREAQPEATPGGKRERKG
jgi:hypothetical protein